jgi:transposase-like protein
MPTYVCATCGDEFERKFNRIKPPMCWICQSEIRSSKKSHYSQALTKVAPLHRGGYSPEDIAEILGLRTGRVITKIREITS